MAPMSDDNTGAKPTGTVAGSDLRSVQVSGEPENIRQVLSRDRRASSAGPATHVSPLDWRRDRGHPHLLAVNGGPARARVLLGATSSRLLDARKASPLRRIRQSS